ncbi:MAG: ATP-binding protein [Okeania sp. SIO3I5]|uniref:ATP-binding protein n=1 Tax=Okeania sp. SIO3I5 TaxID=2607805 RepID=UPI0013BA127A|nr:ATP-binding protein [Okeania sp. SIO3I5]NEQ39856.1 ATP-binding protein [Okeania sp. SIO3I5]
MTNVMTLIKNPYTIGSPIFKPEDLFGRDKILSFIQQQLTSGAKAILLHGQRRIGMTSLMNYIAEDINLDEFVFVRLSLEDKHHKSLDKILYDLARNITDELGISRNRITIPSQEDLKAEPQDFFDIFLLQVYQELKRKNLVLLIDEFDMLWDNSCTEINPFVYFLISIINLQEKLFTILFVGRQGSSLEFIQGLFREVGELPCKELGLLDKSDTIKLITEIPREVTNYQYDPDAIEAIWELSCGHPYYTQLLCFCLFQQARNQDKWNVTYQDVKGVIDRSFEQGEPAFVSPLEVLSTLEKIILSAVAEAQKIATNSFESNIISPFLILEMYGAKFTENLIEEVIIGATHLVNLGFLEQIGVQKFQKIRVPTYRVKIELFRLWLLKQYPLEAQRNTIKVMFPKKPWFQGILDMTL